jgi:hypothetical protein
VTNLIKNHDYTGAAEQVGPNRLRPERFGSEYTQREKMAIGDEGQFYSGTPEEKIWDCDHLDPDVRTEMGLDGVEKAWYIFGNHVCWHGLLNQVVELEMGRYTLTIPVYPDVYEYDNGKIPPDLHLDSEWDRAMRIQLYLGNSRSGWVDEASVDGWYLNDHVLSFTFPAREAGLYKAGLEVWAPWPIKNTGLVLGPWSLERVGAVAPEPKNYNPPREEYQDHVSVLMSQPMKDDRRWGEAAGIVTADWAGDFGYSADRAMEGRIGTVYAVNPEDWASEDDDLYQFADREYPGTEIIPIEAATPYEMAVKLCPKLTEDIALAQQDSRWRELSFGEQPSEPGEMGRYGCFLTGLAIILRKVYGADVTPPVLDKLLVMAGAAYWDDNLLDWKAAVGLFPELESPIKDNSVYTAGDLSRVLSDGYEIILRQASPQHFVYLESVSDTGRLTIIDTWDGERKVKNPGDYQGIRAARVVGSVNPTPPEPQYEPTLLFAMHAQHNMEGLPEMAAQVGAVKFVEDVSSMRALDPQVFRVFRNYLTNYGIHRYVEEGDPKTYCDEHIAPYLDHYGDVMDAIEDGLNERIAPWTPDENKKMRDWALYIRDFVDSRSGGKVKTVMLNPGPGAFPLEGEGIEIFDPVFKASHEHGDYIGMHPYFPVIGEHTWLNEWYVYRFKKVDRYARSKGWFPLYLGTEFGPIGGAIDENGVPHLNAGIGWRHPDCLSGDWGRHQQLSGEVGREFIDWNERHGNRYRHLFYFTVFAWGWDEFRYYTEQFNDIAALAQALRE